MSLPVNAASLQPEDFTVVGASGARRTPQCATLQPADSPGELRTVLLVGQLGGSDDPPLSLMITGEVLALDGYGSAFAGSVVVTPLADGPSLVLAEQMAVVDAGCSTNTSLRVTWDGGVSPDPPAQSYQVLLGDGRTLNAESLTDIGDMDNHHVLCVPSNPDDLLVPSVGTRVRLGSPPARRSPASLWAFWLRWPLPSPCRRIMWTGISPPRFPVQLTQLGDGVFESCSSLTSVALPDGLTQLGDDVFSGCSSLTSVANSAGFSYVVPYLRDRYKCVTLRKLILRLLGKYNQALALAL